MLLNYQVFFEYLSLNQSLNAKLFVLKEDVNFLKKVVSVVKEFKL